MSTPDGPHVPYGGHLAQAVALAGPEVGADLAAYVSRLRHLDPASVLRLVVRGDALGVFARPPFEVLAFRAFPVAAGTARTDLTAAAAELAVDNARLRLPAPVPAPAWAAVLPPREGWVPLGSLPVAEVVVAVKAGVDAFRAEAAAVPESRRTPAVLEVIARGIWSRDLLAPVTLGAAHAALKLGLLAPRQGGVILARANGPWLRLEGRHGVIFQRRPGAPAINVL